jgi:curli biogenesis system outer membrane secretion channel CsgG
VRLIALLPLLAVLPLSGAARAAAEVPVVAVLAFDDQTDALVGRGNTARTLRERLTLELRAHGFKVMGQEQLASSLSTDEMLATAPLEPGRARAIGKKSGARYLLSGVITAYDEQIDTQYKKSILASGGRYERVAQGSTLSLDLVLVDATDGKVLLGRHIGGYSATERTEMPSDPDEMARQDKSGPGARAIGHAVIEIADYLECELVRRDDCLVEYRRDDEPPAETPPR